jgi:hypothetical protein
MKDSLGNELVQGLFVGVEISEPIRFVKGQIETIELGGISTLHAPGKDPKAKLTRIVVMTPVELYLDPRADVAAQISALKIPETYNPAKAEG